MQRIRPAEVVAYFAGGGLVCVAFLALLHLVSTYSKFANWLGQDGAAWVQAIGSVAALTITIWLWRHAATEEERRARLMCNVFCGQLSFTLKGLQKFTVEGDPEGIRQRLAKLTEVRAYGRLIKLDALPPSAMWNMLSVLAHAAQAEQTLTRWSNERPLHLQQLYNEARSLGEVTDHRVEEMLDSLGGLDGHL